MLASIIIELLGTKMGKCNEISDYKSNINLMMNMKATMQLVRRIKKSL